MITLNPPTRRHLHLDAVGGMAGDMFVAALLDAYPALVPRVMNDIRAILPCEFPMPILVEAFSCGIRAQRFGLSGSDSIALSTAADVHLHRHHQVPVAAHDQRRNDIGPHDEQQSDQRGVAFASLLRLFDAVPLSLGTAAEARDILTILAEAEAFIHGVPPAEVHFHEVGDWDSLMDVVAAGSIIAALRPAIWTVSDLPRGGGLVSTTHGKLPVPAPATTRILTGFRWRDDGVQGERVTPTGAAILRHLCKPNHQLQNTLGVLVTHGSGAGTRQLTGMPNILQVTAYEDTARETDGDIVVLTFDVDDMTGEEIGTAVDRLRSVDGVLDLVLDALSGKKNRPATRFELLVLPEAVDEVTRACFAETSTIGLRKRPEQRAVIPRTAATQNSLRVKIAERPTGEFTAKVESDDLRTGSTLANRRRMARKAIEQTEGNGNG